MSNDPNNPTDSTEPTPSTADDAAAEAEATEPTDADRVAELESELAELSGKLLRAHADYQNAIRRGQQNVVEARQQQLRDVALPLVNVIDHFDRAMEIEADKVTADSVLEGVRIVHDELLRALEGFGVKRIDVQPGDEFDPHKHEAMMQQPSDSIPSQHVILMLQPGYTLGERTLRPAKVIIAQSA